MRKLILSTAALLLAAFSLSAQSFNPGVDAMPLAAGNTLHGLAGTANAVTYTVFGISAPASGSATSQILAQGQLGSSDSVLYYVPANTTAFVSLVNLSNTTGTQVTGVTLAVNGSAASAGFQILPGVTIAANGFVTMNSKSWQAHDVSGNVLQTGTAQFDATAAAPSTPLALSTSGTATVAAKRDHTHQTPGGVSAITAATSAISNSETLVVSAALPAGFMQAGTTFRIRAMGTGTTSTTPGNDTFNVRIGTGACTSNTAVTSVAIAATASVTAQPFSLEAVVSIDTTGVSGTAIGEIESWATAVSTGLFGANGGGVSATTATSTVDTTAAETLCLSFVSGASTSSATFRIATIEVVKM